MEPLQHELEASYQMVNFTRFGVVNFTRFGVFSLNRTGVVNFIGFCNYETIPQGLESLLEELATEPATKFTYDLDGNELPEPKTSVDLGIFPVPTGLVILECSNQDGVKPIGFPQEDAPDPDVIIPRQYSPAIIADSCDNP